MSYKSGNVFDLRLHYGLLGLFLERDNETVRVRGAFHANALRGSPRIYAGRGFQASQTRAFIFLFAALAAGFYVGKARG